jgi:hypothetical protein
MRAEDFLDSTPQAGGISAEDFLGPAKQKKQNQGIAADLVTDVKRGVEQLPGAVTGLVDIPIAAVTGSPLVSGLADKAGEITGFQPSKWAKQAEAEYSPSRQAGRAEVDKAWEQGTASDIAGAYLKNPMNIVGSVAESLPSMLAGGLAGRAALGIGAAQSVPGIIARTVGTKMAPAVGAGIGEGGIMAGQAMQNSLDAGVDPRTAAGYAGATGLVGGALGALGGKVAQKMGVVDPETLIAGGVGRQASSATGLSAAREVGKRIAGGAISEGVFEELPQSVFEQGFQNLAQGKPLTEGVARAGVEGALAGSFMGGAFNMLPGSRYAQAKLQERPPEDEQQPIAGLLPAPRYPVGDRNFTDYDYLQANQAAIDAADKNAADLYAMRDAFEASRQNITLTTDPVPLQQRFDELISLGASGDTRSVRGLYAGMDDKARAQYEKDVIAALSEPIGIRHDANQREVPFTMGEYLDAQVSAEDALRAREEHMAQSGNREAANRLAQLADEEAQQHIGIVQDLARSATQGGALSKAALTGIQTGATRMPAHPERAAIEQQMLADEAAQRELAPIQRLMQSRTDEQVQRIANNEKATQTMRQAAVAEIQRRMTTQAQPTTTSPLQQTATQFTPPSPSIKMLQTQLDKTEPFSEASGRLTDLLQTAVTNDAKKAMDSGEMPVYRVTDHVSVAIHPSAQNPGMVQVTRYTKDGVIGDSQYNNIDDAVTQEGLTHKPRIPSGDAIKAIEQSIAAEAEYQQRKGTNAPESSPLAQTPPQANDAQVGPVATQSFDVTHAATAAINAPENKSIKDAWTAAHRQDDGSRVKHDFFEQWYDGGGVTPEVGSQYDAHGIAKGNPLGALLNILSNGINRSRRFDTAPLVQSAGNEAGAGAGLGTAGGAYKDGPFILLGARGKELSNGIHTVLVADGVANVIPQLQAKFPGIRFVKFSEAQSTLSSDSSISEKSSTPTNSASQVGPVAATAQGASQAIVKIDSLKSGDTIVDGFGDEYVIEHVTRDKSGAVDGVQIKDGTGEVIGRGQINALLSESSYTDANSGERKVAPAGKIVPADIDKNQQKLDTSPERVKETPKNEQVNSVFTPAEPVAKQNQAGAAQPKAEQSKYTGPVDVSSRAGQIELANRAGTIASLKAMNEQLRNIAPDEAWNDKNIEDAKDLDALRDSISQALVGAQRGKPEANPLRKELEELSGKELKAVFDKMGLAGKLMGYEERISALLMEDAAEVRAAIKAVAEPAKAQEPATKELTAEQKIRAAFEALPSITMDKLYPITVEHNGVTREFIAYQQSIGRGNNKSVIHLANVKRGKLIASDDSGSVVNTYTLDGKDNLKETGLPRYATPGDMKQWTDAGFKNPMGDKPAPVDAVKQPETKAAEQEAKPEPDNENGNVKYSKASNAPAGEELVAIHNLTAENVLHADSIGGIPVPSIGITKLSSPFTDFGEITLIADKGMIDPENSVPVFDRDAYTARFPEFNYKKVTAKKADAFYERMNVARELGDDGQSFISQLWDAVKNARVQSPKKVADLFRTYLAPRMLYAKEVLGKEIKAPMIPIKASVFFGHEKSWRDFVKNNAELKRTDEDAYNAAAAKAIKIAANEFMDRASADNEIRSQMRSAYMAEVDRYAKDSVNWNYLDRAIKSAQDFGKKRVDAVALSNRVAKIVPQDDSGYLKWASNEISDLFVAPTITLRGKEVEASLDNIVEAMTIGKTNGAEKTMTFGVGKTSALLGKRFRSIKEIQDHRKQVVSSSRESDMKKDSEKLLEEYRLKAVEHFTHTDWKGHIDTFAGFDAAMEALAKAGKGALTDGNIASAMRSVGFKNVPSDVINLARQGIVSIREAATDYFEAKPQRAVKLNEFNGAVVPNGTNQEVIDALKASGITDIRTYKRGDEEGRKKSIALLAKKIHAQNKNTLFSNSAKSATQSEPLPRQQAERLIKSILGDKLGKVLIDSGIVTLVDTEQGLRNLNGAKYMVAWHGSPHDHNKFDSSKIGTGEGAQAYGYGLYFAGSRDVAEYYKETLTNRDAQGYANAHLNAKNLVDRFNGDAEWAAEVVSDQLRNTEQFDQNYGRLQKTLEFIKSGAYAKPLDNPGKLYQVELAPSEDEYLDWDKPLSEQSDTVKAAIEKIKTNPEWQSLVDRQFGGDVMDQATGRDLYKHLANNAIAKAHIGKSGKYVSLPAGFNKEKAASEYLHSLGIRGIRYLDGSSRSAGQGNSNYVIFSDDDVAITAKYAKQNGGIQGATLPDGRIALVLENLTKDNFAGVFQHEGFHSTIRDLVGEQTYAKLMKQLENMHAMGRGAQWVKDANAAIPSDTKAEHRTEELAAYSIEQYVNGAKQPNIITRWVESLLSALRTAIIRRLPSGKLKEWAVNNIQPQDLANLAIAGLKAKARGQLQAQGREAMAYSKINQTDTPAFKKWFGDSKVVDADGKPLVVYHGTNADFSEFKTTRGGEFGPAIYFTDSPREAGEYSEAVKGVSFSAPSAHIMPMFVRIENPYTKGVDEFWKEFGGVGSDADGVERAKAAGYDGVIAKRADRYYDNDAREFVDRGNMLTHYIAFDKSQAKSAIGNNGNFDGTNPDIRYSRAQIIGDSGRQYDQTQRQFFKNVGRDIEKKNLVERTTEYLKNDFWKKMAVGIVDQFRGLRDLGDNGQAYMLARLSKGTAGAFDALLHHGKLSIRDGVYDADTSGGFIERLGVPLHGELDDFLWYVAANRAEGLSKVDRENLFTPQDIAAGKSLARGQTNFDYTIQTGPQKGTTTRNRTAIYADANRVFNEFQKNTLDMAEQSGLIDGASRKLWESEFYVPFYRVSEEDGEFIGSKMGNALVRQQAFKKLKGGTDKLNSDLLSNTLLNFSHLIEASAKNRAAKASLCCRREDRRGGSCGA